MWTILPELAMGRLLSSVASGEAIRSADDPRLRSLRPGARPGPLRAARRALAARGAGGDDPPRPHPRLAAGGAGVPLLLRVRVRRPRRVEAVAGRPDAGGRGRARPRYRLQGLLRRVSVTRPATSSGFWPASARRQAMSSVAPGLTSPSAPCVLAWLGARDPETRKRDRADHVG